MKAVRKFTGVTYKDIITNEAVIKMTGLVGSGQATSADAATMLWPWSLKRNDLR